MLILEYSHTQVFTFKTGTCHAAGFLAPCPLRPYLQLRKPDRIACKTSKLLQVLKGHSQHEHNTLPGKGKVMCHSAGAGLQRTM